MIIPQKIDQSYHKGSFSNLEWKINNETEKYRYTNKISIAPTPYQYNKGIGLSLAM